MSARDERRPRPQMNARLTDMWPWLKHIDYVRSLKVLTQKVICNSYLKVANEN